MIEDVLAGLLRANVAGAVSVLAVLAVRRPLRTVFGARAAYGLWVLPLAGGLASLLPQPIRETPLSPFVATAAGFADQAVAPALAWPSAPAWLTAAWVAGVLATGLLLALRQARFMTEVRAGRAGPAVVGVLAPRIVTPDDFARRFGPEERKVILDHEAQHLARGDTAMNALAAALVCLCWFNPLAHVAARRMRIDQELACDEAVLARTPAARRLYGEVLLKTQLSGRPLPLGCHWPPAAAHPLKERIAMLRSPLPGPARRIVGLVLIAGLSLGGAAAAWAAQGPAREAPLIAQPDWVRRPTAEDVARYYPPAAAASRLAGGAVIACDVTADGRLSSCTVVREDPTGAGFGDAALKMSADFEMKPMSKGGHPVAGGKVRIPIRFMTP